MILSFWSDPSAIIPSAISLITLVVVTISAIKMEGLRAKYSEKNYRKKLYHDYEFTQLKKLISMAVNTLEEMVVLSSRISDGSKYIKDRQSFYEKYSQISEMLNELLGIVNLNRVLLSKASIVQLEKSIDIIIKGDEMFTKIVLDLNYKPHQSELVSLFTRSHRELRTFISMFKDNLN